MVVDFDNSLKMPVCSRYGTDLFQKYFRPDGRTYNVCQLYCLWLMENNWSCCFCFEQIHAITVRLL